jgi:hypothetical protein
MPAGLPTGLPTYFLAVSPLNGIANSYAQQSGSQAPPGPLGAVVQNAVTLVGANTKLGVDLGKTVIDGAVLTGVAASEGLIATPLAPEVATLISAAVAYKAATEGRELALKVATELIDLAKFARNPSTQNTITLALDVGELFAPLVGGFLGDVNSLIEDSRAADEAQHAFVQSLVSYVGLQILPTAVKLELQAEAAVPAFVQSVGTYQTGVIAEAGNDTNQAIRALVIFSKQHPLLGSVTFVGGVAGTARAGSVAVHHLAGTVTFILTGDGSAGHPFSGVMNLQGTDTVNSTVPGVPGSANGFGNVTVLIQSVQNHITARGSGQGFTFSFDGAVGALEQNVTGNLTITISDGFGSSTTIGVNATPQ